MPPYVLPAAWKPIARPLNTAKFVGVADLRTKKKPAGPLAPTEPALPAPAKPTLPPAPAPAGMIAAATARAQAITRRRITRWPAPAGVRGDSRRARRWPRRSSAARRRPGRDPARE